MFVSILLTVDVVETNVLGHGTQTDQSEASYCTGSEWGQKCGKSIGEDSQVASIITKETGTEANTLQICLVREFDM